MRSEKPWSAICHMVANIISHVSKRSCKPPCTVDMNCIFYLRKSKCYTVFPRESSGNDHVKCQTHLMKRRYDLSLVFFFPNRHQNRDKNTFSDLSSIIIKTIILSTVNSQGCQSLIKKSISPGIRKECRVGDGIWILFFFFFFKEIRCA